MTTVIDTHGAWRRRWVTIGGGERFETQHARWLQAGDWYADLRVAFHAAAVDRCFLGRSGWEGERYRWTHDLDLEGIASPTADDVGDLSWEDGLLVERGLFPTPSGSVAYEEGWERVPGDGGPWAVYRSAEVWLAQVGDHAVTVADRRPRGGQFGACYRVLDDGAWRVDLAIGDGASLAGPADLDGPAGLDGPADLDCHGASLDGPADLDGRPEWVCIARGAAQAVAV